MGQEQADPQLLTLSTLVQLQQEARHAQSPTALAYLIVNETHRLIPYQQSILWRIKANGRLRIEAVSGVAQADVNAPFIQWLRRLIDRLLTGKEATACHGLTSRDIPETLGDGWKEWSAGNLLWQPMSMARESPSSGLLLFRATPWSDGEKLLLEKLCDAYAHAMGALEKKNRSPVAQLGAILARRPWRLLSAAILLASLALPINESALAPAAVVPVDPIVVSAPLDGVVKNFHVQPNQPVAKGDLLFSLDKTTIQSQNEVAAKVLATARADYLRASQKAFRDSESKAELASLRAVVEEKTAELAYSARLLERIRVRAEQAGVALFSDPNAWLGKPVVTGEKVLTLADPARAELRAWIPVADAINLEPGARVRLFLNTDPTHPLAATLYQTTYEAEIAPDGVLAFPIKARFDKPPRVPRIGLKGTAKIYGREVTLFYYLFRRPIAYIRQFSGI